MSDNQEPRQYDVVLGGQSQSLEGAAVLGGIEGVKLRLSNPDSKVRVAALYQAFNYGEQGLDLVIHSLQHESPEVQIQAYSLLTSRTELKVKQALLKFNPQILKLEPIEVVTVNSYGDIIQRQQHLAKYFIEDLENGVTLEMVQIPGGKFLMGSPEEEEGQYLDEEFLIDLKDFLIDIQDDIYFFDSLMGSPEGGKRQYSDEDPQHQVTVPEFFMGKYQVTQEQYQAIMGKNRSKFKGNKRPVENISWYDAVEFCQKLSQKTGRTYRLPSEAEWEYACRAGTTTPFHFGKGITSELANYFCIFTYDSLPEGQYRLQTTTVGNFPPNAFGLYDMHGNVWEWCLDDSHKNYEGAPSDGSPWLDDNDNLFEKKGRAILRGGSWFYYPQNCRSASRVNDHWAERDVISSHIGFRVVCAVGKILQ